MSLAVYGPPHSCPRSFLVAGPADPVIRLALSRGLYAGSFAGADITAVDIQATVWEAEELTAELSRAGYHLDRDVWVACDVGGREAGA
jgi:hypothetical protein